MHTEAVAALFIHVKLGGLLRGRPFFVQQNAVWGEAEIVVGCCRDEDWGRIGGDGGIFEPACAGIDAGYKRGAALRLVFKSDSSRNRTPGGKTNDANTVGRDSRIRRRVCGRR